MNVRNIGRLAALVLFGASFATSGASAQTAPTMVEPPFFADAVAAKTLPPVAERIPEHPSVVSYDGTDKKPGRYGGTLRMLGGSAKDTRIMVIYGYARLVGYYAKFEIVPDIAESVDIEEGQGLHLPSAAGPQLVGRRAVHLGRFPLLLGGHRQRSRGVTRSARRRSCWSTARSRRSSSRMRLTVRYSWSKPNPYFLPALAAAQPVEIFRPAHYLKQFHAKYAGLENVEEDGGGGRPARTGWRCISRRTAPTGTTISNMPTLQPWVLEDRAALRTASCSSAIPTSTGSTPPGCSFPISTRSRLTVASADLIPAKVACRRVGPAGRLSELLQLHIPEGGGRAQRLPGPPLAGHEGSARCALSRPERHRSRAAQALPRTPTSAARCRSAIDRDDINNTIFYGVCACRRTTRCCPNSPLFKEEYQTKWAQYDPDLANQLLDRSGPDQAGRRRHPAPAERSAAADRRRDGGRGDRADRRAGAHRGPLEEDRRLALHQAVAARGLLQPDQFRATRRWRSGAGLENAMLKPDMSPAEFAPRSPDQFEWPAWGLWAQTSGQMGEEPDLEAVKQLMALNATNGGKAADSPAREAAIWSKILTSGADQVFTIGIVSGVRAARWRSPPSCRTCRRRASTTSIPAPISASTGPTRSGSPNDPGETVLAFSFDAS